MRMEKIYYNNSLLKRSSELRKDKNFLKSILNSENVNFIPMRDDENYFISGKEEIKPLILKRQELEHYTKDINLDNVGYLSSNGQKNIWDVDLKKYTHLVFGPESVGLPKDILKENGNTLTIPMNSDSRSINLANAVSIVAYEYLRQNYEK